MTIKLSEERCRFVDATKTLGEDEAAEVIVQLLADLMDMWEQTDLEDPIIAAHDAFKLKRSEGG